MVESSDKLIGASPSRRRAREEATGPNEASAAATSTRSTSTRVRDGKLEAMKESNSRKLQLRLYVDGRYFTHSTSDLRDGALDSFMKEAVALTRAIEPDPYRGLPDPALYAGRTDKDLELVDTGLGGLTADARVQRCKDLAGRLRHDKLISATASLSDGIFEVAGATSNGFVGAYSSTWLGQYASLTLRGAGDRRPEGGMGATTRHAADLPPVDWIAAEAVKRASDRLGSKKGPTIKTTMVVDRMAVARLLYPLLMPASGRALQQGRSFWAGKKDKPVMSKLFEVVDDPHIARGMGSRAFDSEGLAAKPMVMVKDGALRGHYIDTYYAKKLKWSPTRGDPTNLVIKTGSGDLQSLAKQAGKGVYVTSWLGGNSDSTSGDFSLGLRGHLIENGQIGAPVGEMNVSGNLIDLFSRLVAVGDDSWIHSSARTPTMVFEGVSFSGA